MIIIKAHTFRVKANFPGLITKQINVYYDCLFICVKHDELSRDIMKMKLYRGIPVNIG